MLQILLHSSKTMSSQRVADAPLGAPLFQEEAKQLAAIWRKAPLKEIQKLMGVSAGKAAQVSELYEAWTSEPDLQVPAIDAFRGDIYSGFQTATLSKADRSYAHNHLVILSGLYGALRACDGIMPYRLEMGYKLPNGKSMYAFWGKKLPGIIRPDTSCLVNLSAVEYTKALLPLTKHEVVTPKFMTANASTGEPVFVTVHAKIARGAFARWLVTERIDDVSNLNKFTELGYQYDATASTPEQPVFVCKVFQGLGLSVRLFS